jgi:hypothetical protein
MLEASGNTMGPRVSMIQAPSGSIPVSRTGITTAQSLYLG